MTQLPDVIRITEPGVLKAMAHPLRARLYYALFARGTARAADLARELEVPANQVSFHLRLMARYGLIVEAPEHARDKRDRVWRPASNLGLDRDPALTGSKAYQQASHAAAHRVLDAFLTRSHPGFHHANDITVHLSPSEAEEFASDVQDLLMRWNRHGQQATAQNPRTDRVTYLATLLIQPLPD